ncbi:putative two-component system sensor kinase [Yersinia aldovae]|nr:putative two-component system sensor kinase [Yersinia aldovae]
MHELVKVVVNDARFEAQVPGGREPTLQYFFPFVRVKSAMSGKGYGLGLAITRKVILAHGGQVEARSGEQGGLVITLRVARWLATE